MPPVFFFHCSAVRLRSSSTSPLLGSRHISGITTTCLPPTAAVSFATSSIWVHTASQESSWCRCSNTVPADSFRLRAASSSRQLLRIGRQVAVRAQLDPLVTGRGHLVEEPLYGVCCGSSGNQTPQESGADPTRMTLIGISFRVLQGSQLPDGRRNGRWIFFHCAYVS